MEYQKCLAKLHSDKTKFDEVVSKGMHINILDLVLYILRLEFV